MDYSGSERDARTVLAAAVDIAEAARDGVDPAKLLALIEGVVSCDVISWSNMNKQRGVGLQHATTVELDGNWDAMAAYARQHPLCNQPRPPVVSWDDVVTRSEWERTDLYCEVFRPLGVRHELILQLGVQPPGFTNNVLFARMGGHDFDERDRRLLWLLRPHLEAALRPARQPNRLTGRQRQVLAMVREGHTNAQIASRLRVTPGTVRAHLEQIFERLGVHNRVGAIAEAAAELDSVG